MITSSFLLFLIILSCLEGLPRGIILPDDLVDEDLKDVPAHKIENENKTEKSRNYSEKDSFSDDEEYFSVDEEETKTPCHTADAATQTDPCVQDSVCQIM